MDGMDGPIHLVKSVKGFRDDLGQSADNISESQTENASERGSLIFRQVCFGFKSTFETIVTIKHDGLLIGLLGLRQGAGRTP